MTILNAHSPLIHAILHILAEIAIEYAPTMRMRAHALRFRAMIYSEQHKTAGVRWIMSKEG